MEIAGVPGEAVRVMLFAPQKLARVAGAELVAEEAGAKGIQVLQVVIPESGRAVVEVE
jgi:hypothetical protein